MQSHFGMVKRVRTHFTGLTQTSCNEAPYLVIWLLESSQHGPPPHQPAPLLVSHSLASCHTNMGHQILNLVSARVWPWKTDIIHREQYMKSQGIGISLCQSSRETISPHSAPSLGTTILDLNVSPWFKEGIGINCYHNCHLLQIGILMPEPDIKIKLRNGKRTN